MGFIADTPEKIEAVRLLAVRGRLSLELQGIRFRINTFPLVKKEFGFKGNNKSVFEQYENMLRERGLIE